MPVIVRTTNFLINEQYPNDEATLPGGARLWRIVTVTVSGRDFSNHTFCLFVVKIKMQSEHAVPVVGIESAENRMMGP